MSKARSVTELDFLKALAQELTPAELGEYEFLQSELMTATGLTRFSLGTRLAPLLASGEVTARKDVFLTEGGQRREQWAYKFAPDKVRETLVRLKQPPAKPRGRGDKVRQLTKALA